MICVCVLVTMCVLCLFLEDHCHSILIVHEKSEVNHSADIALTRSEKLKILLVRECEIGKTNKISCRIITRMWWN